MYHNFYNFLFIYMIIYIIFCLFSSSFLWFSVYLYHYSYNFLGIVLNLSYIIDSFMLNLYNILTLKRYLVTRKGNELFSVHNSDAYSQLNNANCIHTNIHNNNNQTQWFPHSPPQKKKRKKEKKFKSWNKTRDSFKQTLEVAGSSGDVTLTGIITVKVTVHLESGE